MPTKTELVKKAINLIPAEFWVEFRRCTLQRGDWFSEREWWHNKLYEFNVTNRGYEEQTVLGRSEKEIPWSRELFHPSPDERFGLRDLPVAYFSEDFSITCCETVEQFHDTHSLEYPQLLEYLLGNPHADGRWYEYPQAVRVEPEAVIADLTSSGSDLFTELVRAGDLGTAQEFFEDTILSWDMDCRHATQLIASVLFMKGFSGVLYKPVMAP